MQTFEPLADRILIEVCKAPEVTQGGIIIPQKAQNTPQQGKVIAVGPGRELQDGTLRPMNVSVGDTVAFAKYGGTEIELDNRPYLLLEEVHVLGIMREVEPEIPWDEGMMSTLQPDEEPEQDFDATLPSAVDRRRRMMQEESRNFQNP
jgi:chaperonin GroES